jgi:hypothetical protein
MFGMHNADDRTIMNKGIVEIRYLFRQINTDALSFLLDKLD